MADLDYLDLLLVTHAAYDHLGDTEKILRRFPDLPLICGADVRRTELFSFVETLSASLFGGSTANEKSILLCELCELERRVGASCPVVAESEVGSSQSEDRSGR